MKNNKNKKIKNNPYFSENSDIKWQGWTTSKS